MLRTAYHRRRWPAIGEHLGFVGTVGLAVVVLEAFGGRNDQRGVAVGLASAPQGTAGAVMAGQKQLLNLRGPAAWYARAGTHSKNRLESERPTPLPQPPKSGGKAEKWAGLCGTCAHATRGGGRVLYSANGTALSEEG